LLGRDSGQDALQLDEPAGTGDEIADDQQRPLVADEIERAGVRRPLVIWMTLGGRYVWNEVTPVFLGRFLPTEFQHNG
jgi:hypothetical protein